MRRKETRKVVPPPLEEQISHCLMALKMREFFAHDIQGIVTEWIRNNYGMVNPETVQRTWRKMMESPDIIVEKEKKGRLTRYRLLQLGNIKLGPGQLDLFDT